VATRKATPKKAVKKAPVKKSVIQKPAAKKSAAKKPKTTNLDRLVAADVIQQANAADHDAKVINKLSAAEVNTLIKLRKKLGAAAPASVPGGGGSRPNFPV
jgi:hypothetical protein